MANIIATIDKNASEVLKVELTEFNGHKTSRVFVSGPRTSTALPRRASQSVAPARHFYSTRGVLRNDPEWH